jgi:hypothetical protein
MDKKRQNRTNRVFYLISILVIVLAAAKLAVHLNFWVIALVFSGIGLVSSLWNRKVSLMVFFFLLPFINATPGFVSPEYPFNYIAPSLFLLSGMIIVPLFRGVVKPADSMLMDEKMYRAFASYRWFLWFLLLSFGFLCLRWSNITLDSFAAAGADTPVSPGPRGQRISFASVFPVVSLFIYFISPYIYVLARRAGVTVKECFKWVSAGFFVSVTMGLLQKISGKSLISDRLDKELKQFYGGFSDFNAFGFFSGVMFLWATVEIKKKNRLAYAVFTAALAGCILSGSRTVFFFIIAGIINLFLPVKKRDASPNNETGNKKKQKWLMISLLIVVLVVVVSMGGTLIERLGEGFGEKDGAFEKLNTITNGRLWMTLFSLRTIRSHFFAGVGTGNFTFYLDYKNVGEEDYLYDLTLNQYTLVFTENGVFAFVFFTFFLLSLARNSTQKLLLGMILFTLLINNFFWFPEAFLLFWLLAALYTNRDTNMEQPKVRQWEFLSGGFIKKYKAHLLAAAVVIFVLFNLVRFNALHPRTWAGEIGARYDYGFWYPEKEADGREFRWTRASAGLYLNPAKDGEPPVLKLVCGAPLERLEGKQQKVTIYWRGELYREVTFTRNSEMPLKINDETGRPGFLELRAQPVFNLEKMGLGAETRDLGIKLSIE